jgi:transformation/transcription domain-associated protein
VRHGLWDLLNRLPHTDVLQPYARELGCLAMDALQLENEDNAILCVKTIFELHKVSYFTIHITSHHIRCCKQTFC